MTAIEVVLSLDVRRQRIEEILEDAAISIGEELLEAKRDHPGQFMGWVEQCLPFGIDKAERMMAVSKAFASCPVEDRAMLPTGWTVLFELRKLPSERFYQALGDGEVHPDMTLIDAKRLADQSSDIHPDYVPRERKMPEPNESQLTADIVASELVRFPRSTLSPTLEFAVREWLDAAN